MIKTNNSKVVI